MSGSTSHKTKFCVKLAAGEANMQKKCWIRIPAVQPLMKADLQDLIGQLNEEQLGNAQARLAQYLGLLTEEA